MSLVVPSGHIQWKLSGGMGPFNVMSANIWTVGGVEPQATILGCAWSGESCKVICGGDASAGGAVVAAGADAVGEAAVVGVGRLQDAGPAQVGVAAGVVVTPGAAANVDIPVRGALLGRPAADADAEPGGDPEPTLDARCGGFEPK